MKLLGRAIAELAIAVLGIATLVFLAFAVLPVDPARAVLGPMASEAAVKALRTEYGLDDPIPVRYVRSMSLILQGDFGQSFFFGRPARAIVLELAPITFARAGAALLLGLTGGMLLPWGVGRVGGERWVRRFLVVLQSLPSFAVMLIILWLVSRGFARTPLGSPYLYEMLAVVGASLYPLGTVGFFVLERMSPSQGVARHIEFLQMLGAPRGYIRAAMMRDAYPGALAITLNALSVTLTSAVFAELVFGLRGFGVVFIRSCERGDLSVVMAGSMILCLVVILVQRLGDTLVRFLDPRFAGA